MHVQSTFQLPGYIKIENTWIQCNPSAFMILHPFLLSFLFFYILLRELFVVCTSCPCIMEAEIQFLRDQGKICMTVVCGVVAHLF